MPMRFVSATIWGSPLSRTTSQLADWSIVVQVAIKLDKFVVLHALRAAGGIF